jgi:hypothetical protein
MKQFALGVLAISLISGCGYQQAFRDNCHLEGQTCDTLFGVNQEDIDERQDATNVSQQKQIDSLTTMITELVKDVRNIENQAAQQQQMLEMLDVMALQQGANITAINQMLINVNQDLADIQDKIAYEQARINGLAVDVANLNAQDTVVESVYPCGDRPNRFDEAFLKTKSGKLIAYFEDGGSRFLTVLTPGNYRTTDSAPYCYFSVNSQQQIVNARRQ